MTAISPQDWQDQEDGRALRELCEALPNRRDFWVVTESSVGGFPFVVTAAGMRDDLAEGRGDTLAAAADACRAALRERAA